MNFSYGEAAPILKDVSLIIPDRTTTAIVGPSGSGKTTLQPDRPVLGCGRPCDHRRPGCAGVHAGVPHGAGEHGVPAGVPHADTVENNIKFGCPGATHKQVVEAAKKACCHDFISALPDGYNTVIGEGGATLSGGEKQRIPIARCLLKDAPIVIFDEATATVDPENEDQLQKAMEALTREKTVLMIAHRLKISCGARTRSWWWTRAASSKRVPTTNRSGRRASYRDFVSERTESSRWTL